MLIAAVTTLFFATRITYRNTLREAKNMEFALRLLGNEFYGFDEIPYDPLSADGLKEGVLEQVEQLSGAKGEISLVSWNGTEHAPRRLVYQTQRFVVVFDGDKTENERWSIYYRFR